VFVNDLFTIKESYYACIYISKEDF